MHEAETAGEIIATLVRFLRSRVERWREGVPEPILASVFAILSPTLIRHQLPVRVKPGPGAPQVVATSISRALGGMDDQSLEQVQHRGALTRKVKDDAVLWRESASFSERFERGEISTSVLDDLATLEAFTGAVIAAVDGFPALIRDDVLQAWGLYSMGRLGLDAAIAELRTGLLEVDGLLARVRAHDGISQVETGAVALELDRRVERAYATLRLLRTVTRDRLAQALSPNLSAVSLEVTRGLRVPATISSIFDVCSALCNATARYAVALRMVEQEFVAEPPAATDETRRIAARLDELRSDLQFTASPSDRETLATFDRSALPEQLSLVRFLLLQAFDSLVDVASATATFGLGIPTPPPPRPPLHAAVVAISLCIDPTKVGDDLAVKASVRNGFEILTQWARAFGGFELWTSAGNHIAHFAFSSVDAALASSALIEQHLGALAMAGAPADNYELAIVADYGPIEVFDAQPAAGYVIARAQVLAEHLARTTVTPDRVFTTVDAYDAASPSMRVHCPRARPALGQIDLDAIPDFDATVLPSPYVTPIPLETEQVVRAYAQRIEEGG